MESPYNRPKAANIIDQAIQRHHERLMQPGFWCGLSLEMQIYTALQEAGFLTLGAMQPDEH